MKAGKNLALLRLVSSAAGQHDHESSEDDQDVSAQGPILHIITI
jgi:hypothetical protein